jgi:hypothetical protein
MLILLITSKTYDLDYACGFTGVYTKTYNMVKAGSDLSSLSSEILNLKEAAANNLVNYITELEKSCKD